MLPRDVQTNILSDIGGRKGREENSDHKKEQIAIIPSSP